jgi:hypothetical protein
MKKIILILILTISVSNYLIAQSSIEKVSEVGTPYKTKNKSNPYIFKNGYKKYEIKQILSITGKDTTYLNELKFNAVFSAMYTQKMMYDKFGKWHSEISSKKQRKLILTWQNIKLFENDSELYTVVAYGIEDRKEIYASVIVFDSKNNDCLSANSDKRALITDYFSKGIQKLNSSEEFYHLWYKIMDKY